MLQGEIEEAFESYSVAMMLYRRNKDQRGQAETLCNIGNLYRSFRDHGIAQKMYRRALKIYRRLNDRNNQANTLLAIGGIYKSCLTSSMALKYCKTALDLFQEEQDRLGEANTMLMIGDIQRSRGESEAAQASYEAALNLYRQLRDRHGEADTLSAQSLLWIDRNPARSLLDLDAALSLYQTTGHFYNQGVALGNYGQALIHRTRYGEAMQYLQRARLIFETHGFVAQVQWVGELITVAEIIPVINRQGLPRPRHR